MTQTPKEKAQELYDKYGFVYIQNYSSKSEAKECALILVNEILESAPLSPVVVGQYYENTSDRMRDAIDYWIKVKEEIAKL